MTKTSLKDIMEKITHYTLTNLQELFLRSVLTTYKGQKSLRFISNC